MGLAERKDHVGHDLDQDGPDAVLQVAHALRQDITDVVTDDVGKGRNDDGLGVAGDLGEGRLELLDVADWRQLELRGQLPTV